MFYRKRSEVHRGIDVSGFPEALSLSLTSGRTRRLTARCICGPGSFVQFWFRVHNNAPVHVRSRRDGRLGFSSRRLIVYTWNGTGSVGIV